LRTYFIHSDSHTFTSRQIFKQGSKHTGVGRESTATPPYHWHIYQTESFDVKQGRLCYILDGKEGTLEPGQTVTIPPYVPHTFWSDPTSPHDLDVHITVTNPPSCPPNSPGFTDAFIHNFYGYLSSCALQNLSPNIFQMLKFMDSADVVLMDFPLGTGRLANVVLGRWIGGWLGGYKAEYKEFDED
jgi:quercetin dioxygenase-like cupin family protein